MPGRLIQSGFCAVGAAMAAAACPAYAQNAQEDAPAVPANPGDLLAGNGEQPPATEPIEGPALGVEYPLSNAPRVYLPEDFARFAPRTALQMIERIPGFNIQGGGGGGNGRGFGEASGNLLINGDRISSKSNSVEGELSRIPIDNVLRVEIVDGASLNLPGLSGQVANVIVESTGLSGQFSWRPQISTGPSPIGWSEGEVSVRGATRGVDYSLAFNSGAFFRGSDGPSIFTDADGMIDERYNTQSARFNRPRITGAFAFEIAPQVKVNLNLSGGLTIFRSRERENRIDANPLPDFLETFRTQNNERYYEIGADVEFPLGPGQLKLIGLESFEHGNFRTASLLNIDGLGTGGLRYTKLSDEGERIGRAEYSWAMLGGDWQISGEAAFNRLDNIARLFSYDDPSQAYVEVDFPAGTGGVREKRYESIISYSTSLSSNLSLQIAAGGEYSSISQTGVNALSRTFQRPKGSVSLAWSPGGGLDVSLEVARRVGQLDFEDFLASVDLTQENQNTGNNQLRPQQSWETELELTKAFGAWGSATLTLFDHRVEDFLIIVPTGNGGESRGNIDSARRYGLSFDGTLEFAALGWQGAQLQVRLDAEHSTLSDPVTFINRRFDFNSPYELRLDFRHDVPQTDWAWGLEFRHTDFAKAFRVQEVYLDHILSTFGAVFIENKDVLGLTVRARAGNLFNGRNVLQRAVYAGPRDTAPVLFTEDRRAAIGAVFNLTISGNF